MTINIAKTVARIEQITDEEMLTAVIKACQSRLAELAAAKPQIIRAVLNGVMWYLEFPDGDTEELGQQLSAVATITRANRPSPKTTDFEISEQEAAERRQVDVQSVGWWNIMDDGGQKIGMGYYDVAAFHTAKSKYKQWTASVRDPRASVYRLPDTGIARVLEIERDGAVVVFD